MLATIFLYVPKPHFIPFHTEGIIFMNMNLNEKLKAVITPITEDKVSVEIMLLNEASIGVLYYERPKKGWTNKPIMPSRWRCVDAKVEGVKIYGEGEITPLDLMGWAQERVYEFMRGDISSQTHS